MYKRQPLENPTIISNLVELYSMMILPGACVIAFGNMIADKRKKEGKKSLFGRQGRTVFAAMAIIFLIGVTVCFAAESAGNPVLAGIGLNQDMGSYEGKEVRFGIAQSALFTTTTTSFTTGTVNNMHDSLTPLEMCIRDSICIGMGSSQSSHDGLGLFAGTLNQLSALPRIGCCVAAGNEGNLSRHYHGTFTDQIMARTFELRVGEKDKNFFMEIWQRSPSRLMIGISAVSYTHLRLLI